MDGQPHGSIETALGPVASGNTEGTLTTGTFTFDEDTLRQLITDWQNLADSYDSSLANAELNLHVEAPAEDFASTWHAEAANRSGESYLTYLRHNREYCREQCALFQQALDTYLGVEHRAVTDINDSGPRPGI